MAHEDPSLQELIVRALTGTDARARQTLDQAASKDPQLKQFSEELHQVVDLLVGSREWRNMTPTDSIKLKIREAVIAKLPSAPPQFRTVMLENDLGGRQTALWIVVAVILVLAGVGLAVTWWNSSAVESNLKLSGSTVYESEGNAKPLDGWRVISKNNWVIGGGFHSSAADEPTAIYFAKGLAANDAAAFEVDVQQPGLDEKTTAMLFIVSSDKEPPVPAFTGGARPEQALVLEISRDGMILSSPDRGLLQSRTVSSANPGFYRIRLEHLGRRVRVMLNNEVFFDGFNPVPLKGVLYPGMRVAGPQQSAIRFNAIRIER